MGDLFARTSAAVITLANGCLMLVVWRASFAVAQGRRASERSEGAEHAASLAQTCLALFGLLLAFSFGTVYAKYESRRLETVAEANAIGTFAIRLRLLPEDAREPLLDALRQYIRLHRAIVDPVRTYAERRGLDHEIRALQSRMVDSLTAWLRTPAGGPLTITLLPSLNAVLDQYEVRVAGITSHVPYDVLALVVVMSLVTAWAVGRSEGFAQNFPPRSTIFFLLLVSAALYCTLDLDQPWTGLSRVSESPMERLAESLGAE